MTVAIFENTVCVKIAGRADFTSSLDLKRLIEELWNRNFSHFVFDLTDCTNMDSTFLGVLSGIGLKFSNGKAIQVGAPLQLLNPNPRIAQTLDNLGVADLFVIKNCAEPLAGSYQPVERQADKSPVDLTRNCLEAHLTLMEVKPENVQKFKDVTQFLSDDLKRLEGSTKTDK